MEESEFEIKILGNLKYSRIKSMSILRKELNSYDYSYTMIEVKELLDSILNNTFTEQFNLKYKLCFDVIFDDMKYIEYRVNPIVQIYPGKWIAPSGYNNI